MRVSASEARDGWRDVLDHAQFKGSVEIFRYGTTFELKVVADDSRSYQQATKDAEVAKAANPFNKGLEVSGDKKISSETAIVVCEHGAAEGYCRFSKCKYFKA